MLALWGWRDISAGKDMLSLPRHRSGYRSSSFAPSRAHAAEMKGRSPGSSQGKQWQEKATEKGERKQDPASWLITTSKIKAAKTGSHGHRRSSGDRVGQR